MAALPRTLDTYSALDPAELNAGWFTLERPGLKYANAPTNATIHALSARESTRTDSQQLEV